MGINGICSIPACLYSAQMLLLLSYSTVLVACVFSSFHLWQQQTDTETFSKGVLAPYDPYRSNSYDLIGKIRSWLNDDSVNPELNSPNYPQTTIYVLLLVYNITQLSALEQNVANERYPSSIMFPPNLQMSCIWMSFIETGVIRVTQKIMPTLCTREFVRFLKCKKTI